MFKLGSLAPAVATCMCALMCEVPQSAWTIHRSHLAIFLFHSVFISFFVTLREWHDLKAHNETVEPAVFVGHQRVFVYFIILKKISHVHIHVWQKQFSLHYDWSVTLKAKDQGLFSSPRISLELKDHYGRLYGEKNQSLPILSALVHHLHTEEFVTSKESWVFEWFPCFSSVYLNQRLCFSVWAPFLFQRKP